MSWWTSDGYQYEEEYNDERAFAIPFARKIAGSLDSPSDVDWYAVELTKYENFQVTFEGGNYQPGMYNVAWYTPSMQLVAQTNIYTSTRDGQSTHVYEMQTPDVSGLYYLRVQPYSSATYKSSMYKVAVEPMGSSVPVISLERSESSIIEGDDASTTATLTLLLDRPSATHTVVHYTVRSGTAIVASPYGSDVVGTISGSVTFAPGETSATISGTRTVPDPFSEADEYFWVDFDGISVGAAKFAGNVGTLSAQVTILNDDFAPVATSASYTVPEDGALRAFMPASDRDDASLNYEMVVSPAHGVATLEAGGGFEYRPFADYAGPDSLTFRASDGVYQSGLATVSFDVVPVNDAPVAGNPSITLNEDGSVTSSAPASDLDSATLTFSVASQPAHGSLIFNLNGAYTYTPATNYSGPDAFTFQANDGALDSSPGTVSITVVPVNDAPAVANVSSDGDEDTSISGTLMASDLDSVGVTFSAASQPSHGTVVVSEIGNYRYVPDVDFFGIDSFTYRGSDGALNSNTAMVTLTISPVNDAPVLANPIPDQSATAGSATTFAFSANTFSDVDSATLTYAATLADGSALPSWVVFTPGTRTFRVDPQITDAVTLNVKVIASDGALSVSDTFALSVSTVAGIQVTGTAGRDTLTGGAGSDTINGLAGSDLITGLAGNDTIDGGEGIDTAVYAATRAQATIALGSTTTPNSATVSVPGLGTDSLTRVERLHFTDLDVAFDITPTGNVEDPITKGEGGNAGKAYRLYQAALARTPDLAGLGYWIVQVDNGETLFNIASGFLGSDELKGKYGANPTNAEYTRALYLNVLHREPDETGYAYFNALLEGKPWNGTDYGSTTRQQMLVDFSESVENKANAIEIIGNGFDYQPWV